MAAPGTALETYSLFTIAAQSQQAAGDINADSVVDVVDLLNVIDSWGMIGDSAADVAPYPSGDQHVNLLDLLLVLDNWG